jgi:hypothetical protein
MSVKDRAAGNFTSNELGSSFRGGAVRTILAIIVALAVGALGWVVIALVWNLLQLSQSTNTPLNRLIVEFLSPAIGAFLGLRVADSIAKQYSLDGLYYGFCATVVAGTAVVGVYMLAVAATAGWRFFDWLVMVATPLGAVTGASAARTSLRPRIIS